MRFSQIILIHVFLATIGSLNLASQTPVKYKVYLDRENQKKLEVYDTLVTLEFLSELRYESLTNMQIFEGFNYPRLKRSKRRGTIHLSNDSIKIILSYSSFDSITFKKNYRTDSSLYFNSLYFREFPIEFDFPPFYPKTEITKITISINKSHNQLPELYTKDLYNPNIGCFKYYGFVDCGINGYVADNGNILMTIFCGEGSGAYQVIFLFDNNGSLLKRINEPVI